MARVVVVSNINISSLANCLRTEKLRCKDMQIFMLSGDKAVEYYMDTLTAGFRHQENQQKKAKRQRHKNKASYVINNICLQKL